MSFLQWLRDTGEVDAGQLGKLVKEWTEVQRAAYSNDKAINFTIRATSLEQFIASKYPMKAVAYQTYRRLLGYGL